MRSFLRSIFFWRLLSGREGIGDALNIEDERNTGKYPLGGDMLGLELSGKYVRLISVGGHVARALVDTLIDLVLNDSLGLAVDQGHNGELLFGDRLVHKRGVLVPGGTFKLESKDIGSVFKAV